MDFPCLRYSGRDLLSSLPNDILGIWVVEVELYRNLRAVTADLRRRVDQKLPPLRAKHRFTTHEITESFGNFIYESRLLPNGKKNGAQRIVFGTHSIIEFYLNDMLVTAQTTRRYNNTSSSIWRVGDIEGNKRLIGSQQTRSIFEKSKYNMTLFADRHMIVHHTTAGKFEMITIVGYNWVSEKESTNGYNLTITICASGYGMLKEVHTQSRVARIWDTLNNEYYVVGLLLELGEDLLF